MGRTRRLRSRRFKVTILSSHKGEIGPEPCLYISLLASCELTRPTLARQILARQEADSDDGPEPYAASFLNIFSTAHVKSPTIAEEYLDLQKMVASGMLRREELQQHLALTNRADISMSSTSLLSDMDEGMLPSEDEEIDSLALHRHLGTIPESAGSILQHAIGQHQAERSTTIHQALQSVA